MSLSFGTKGNLLKRLIKQFVWCFVELLAVDSDERLGQSTTSHTCIAKHMAAELNKVIAGEYDSHW